MINIIYVFIFIIILIFYIYKTKQEHNLDLYNETLLNESSDYKSYYKKYNNVYNNIENNNENNNENINEYNIDNVIQNNDDNYYRMYVTFYYSTNCEKCKYMLSEWKKLINELEKYKNIKTHHNIKFDFDIIIDKIIDNNIKHCKISKYCNLINISYPEYNGSESDDYKKYYKYINELYDTYNIYLNKTI
jgi:hypothetical protein